MKKIFAIFLTLLLIAILLLGVMELPPFGLENNPANNDVMMHYIKNATKETGALNIVTGIILDYRAFDTFVEASVLFTAVAAVITVLLNTAGEHINLSQNYGSLIFREISKFLNPFVQVFGIYIILFGHLSPGGGFAGGTIIGAGMIMYYISHANNKIYYDRVVRFICTALILYGILKGYVFITGGSHLSLIQPPLGKPGKILSGGMLLPLNVLVGIVVSSTMYSFFSLFDRGEI